MTTVTVHQAKGLLNHLTVVSNEKVFDAFGVARLW